MRKKKLFAILLTLMLVLSLCACASAQDSDEIPPSQSTVEETDNKDSETTTVEEEKTDTESTEKVEETVNEFGFTETQMNKLYEAIKEYVSKDYLEANNLSANDFAWPEESDVQWYYLVLSLSNYSFGTPENNAEQIIGVEIDETLMDIVYEAFIFWSEENNIPAFQLDTFSIGNASSSIGTLIIENVSFTDETTN